MAVFFYWHWVYNDFGCFFEWEVQNPSCDFNKSPIGLVGENLLRFICLSFGRNRSCVRTHSASFAEENYRDASGQSPVVVFCFFCCTPYNDCSSLIFLLAHGKTVFEVEKQVFTHKLLVQLKYDDDRVYKSRRVGIH